MNDQLRQFLLSLARRLFILAVLGLIGWFGIVPLVHWLLTHPHPLLEALREHMVQHLTEYLGSFVVLFIAFVCTWPVLIPKNAQDWWDWFRNAFQTAIPAARAQQHAAPPQESKENK